eukprot:365842-Chlamydomonas_euryale.AAC.7
MCGGLRTRSSEWLHVLSTRVQTGKPSARRCSVNSPARAGRAAPSDKPAPQGEPCCRARVRAHTCRCCHPRSSWRPQERVPHAFRGAPRSAALSATGIPLRTAKAQPASSLAPFARRGARLRGAPRLVLASVAGVPPCLELFNRFARRA